MIKYDANNIVEFVWGDEFLCYALSGVILEVVADGRNYSGGYPSCAGKAAFAATAIATGDGGRDGSFNRWR